MGNPKYTLDILPSSGIALHLTIVGFFSGFFWGFFSLSTLEKFCRNVCSVLQKRLLADVSVRTPWLKHFGIALATICWSFNVITAERREKIENGEKLLEH